MKHLLAILPLFVLSTSFTQTQETYDIDAVHSSIDFRIKHLGISLVSGSFLDYTGTVVFHPTNPTQSTVNFTVKADSIDTDNVKRDNHLKSADFFNVATYPQLTFKSTSVSSMGPNQYQVKGDLTMHGITKSITFDFEATDTVQDSGGKTRRGGSTTFLLKRSDYGMTYGLPTTIADEVEVILSFSGVKK